MCAMTGVVLTPVQGGYHFQISFFIVSLALRQMQFEARLVRESDRAAVQMEVVLALEDGVVRVGARALAEHRRLHHVFV